MNSYSISMYRQLLQQQEQQQEVPQQQAVGACIEQLGGISVGGWITLSLLAGVLLGVLSTLAVQAWRRRRELRYMHKGLAERAGPHAVAMQALPLAPGTPVHHPHGPHPSAALPAVPSGAAGAPAATLPAAASAVQPASRYFSPLNTNKSVGSVAHVHAQLLELRSSAHLSDSGGDTRAPTASDQHTSRDKAASTGQGPAGHRPRDHSQHGMARHGTQGGAVSNGTAGTGTHQHAVAALGHQLPQEVSSSMLSDCVLQAEDSSSPLPSAKALAPSQLAMDQQQQQRRLMGEPSGSGIRSTAQLQAPGAGSNEAAAAAAAAAGTDAPRSGARQDAGVQPQPAAARGAGASPVATEIEAEYEDDDLDDDWRALLGGVDARLRLQGARALDARERAVAIKKLLVATGTQGVEFALNAALQEVLSFRRIHGN